MSKKKGADNMEKEGMESKTDLRVIKTRKALLDAFLQMLEEKRFENITVNELCERAMVRRATFYKHFMDKYDFFSYFVRSIQQEFTNECQKHKKDENLVSYCGYLSGECIRFLTEHRKLVENVVESSMLYTVLELFQEEIYKNLLLKMQQLYENKKSDSSMRLSVSFYTGGLLQVIKDWILSGGELSKEQLLAEMKTITTAFFAEESD